MAYDSTALADAPTIEDHRACSIVRVTFDGRVKSGAIQAVKEAVAGVSVVVSFELGIRNERAKGG